jgi:hypothetical protein
MAEDGTLLEPNKTAEDARANGLICQIGVFGIWFIQNFALLLHS